jgi:glycosyltransferase involved in cell wall biosynthesis
MSQKFFYIAEFLLPANNAYSIHVLKMCDNSIYSNYKSKLIIPQNNSQFIEIKKKYNLKNNFKIDSLYTKINNLNFFLRIIFGIYVSIKIAKEKPHLIITRSLIASFILSLIRYKHFLEIHGDIKGFTRFIFLKLNFINSKFIIKNIFITHNLAKIYGLNKNKFIVLPDAVDEKDFLRYKPTTLKSINNFYYTGSFYKGKGIELIFKIAKIFKKKKFFVYGNKINLNIKKVPSNVSVNNYVSYNEIPEILNKADALLMPYSKNVFYNYSLNDNIGSFHSPLKMFEYLASGKLIISSNQKVLKEILKNNVNCLMPKNNGLIAWKKIIIYAEKNIDKINKIIKNSKKQSFDYTWSNRIKQIIKFN